MKRLLKKLLLVAMVMTMAVLPAAVPSAAAEENASAFSLKTASKGWRVVDGKKYYYKNGKKVTGIVKIKRKLYAFDQTGALMGATRIFPYRNYYYKVDAKGVATRWTGTAHHAAKVLYTKCKADTLTDMLTNAFKWARDLPYRVVAQPTTTVESEIADYYGKLGLMQRFGDCAVQAYTFYWMAYVLGYNVKVIDAFVYNPANTTTQYKEHTWVELYKGKKAYVCDPNFSAEYGQKVASTRPGLPLGYRVLYGTPNTLRYCRRDKTEIAKYGRA